MSDSQMEKKQPQLYYSKWVGVLCALILPGSTHFLAGQRMWGILWCCGYWSLMCFRWFIASIPGNLFGALTFVLYFISILYIILLFVFSWQPIPRLGCFGWILFLIFAYIFCSYIFRPFVILPFVQNVASFSYAPSSSMSPTICSSTTSPSRLGADIFANNTWIYYYENPQRGDIISFCRYDKNGKVEPSLWAKRVVGLPGETIDIDPPYILINGKRLIEPKIFKRISESQDSYTGYSYYPYPSNVQLPLTLADDEYFLLGDNSKTSVDSRVFGPVKRSDIKSKVVRIVFPFSRIKEFE